MICNKMFGYKQTLTDTIAHGMKGQHQCTFFDRGFLRADGLKKNLKNPFSKNLSLKWFAINIEVRLT